MKELEGAMFTRCKRTPPASPRKQSYAIRRNRRTSSVSPQEAARHSQRACSAAVAAPLAASTSPIASWRKARCGVAPRARCRGGKRRPAPVEVAAELAVEAAAEEVAAEEVAAEVEEMKGTGEESTEGGEGRWPWGQGRVRKADLHRSLPAECLRGRHCDKNHFRAVSAAHAELRAADHGERVDTRQGKCSHKGAAAAARVP